MGTISLSPPARFVHKVAAFLPARSWLLKGRPWLSLKRLVVLAYLKLKRRAGRDYSFTMPEESSVPIDIFMPTLEKDAAILEYTVKYARENIKHPITNIYIVAPPESTKLKKLATKLGCIFVDETSIIDLKKEDVNYIWRGYNKNGWVYKMLLNLAANTVCAEQHILILDSDTLFIFPQIFVYRGKPLFNLSDEYHQPYFDASAHILDAPHRITRSFITHYMLFEADVLAKMQSVLESKWKRPWFRAIIEQMDRSTAMAFADYESYGDFYLRHRPGEYYLNYWSNVSHEIDQFAAMDEWIAKEHAANIHRSLSFHSFIKRSLSREVTTKAPL
jgi:hypothetical protein